MARGHIRDAQERCSELRGTHDKDLRERNTGAARRPKEKHATGGRFDTGKQAQKLDNTGDDLLVDALSHKVSFNDFAKLIEESIARCSECVQTVKDSLKTINKDINGMESEMSTFVGNFKTFESAGKSCTYVRKKTPDTREVINTGKSNNTTGEQRHDKRGTKKNNRTTSGNTKHDGVNNKPHSAESSQAKKCLFPPINTKPSLTGARPRSPTSVASFHDQTGESKLSQIKKIAKKRSIEQYHQKNMTDERFVLKSLKDNKRSAWPGDTSKKARGKPKEGSIRNKNANGLVMNATCNDKHEEYNDHFYKFDKSKASIQKLDPATQDKRASSARNSDRLKDKQHCKDTNASRAKCKDISPYAEKQLLTSLIKPDRSTIPNQTPSAASNDTKPQKPTTRKSNFKLESWKTSNDPGSGSDDIPISTDSFGHRGNKTDDMGVKSLVEDEKRTSKKTRKALKKKQCHPGQKKRWQ